MIRKIAIIGSIIIMSGIVGFILLKPSPELDRWAKMYIGAGSNCSPRPVDLNSDGVKDLVMGAGSTEFDSTAFAVFAIDGNTGEVMWQVPGINQVFGSPIFKDISGDSVPDVFIGGRSAQFFAINGKTGEIIWEYLKPEAHADLRKDTALLNFYTPQFIRDQNGDGYEDMIVTFGGLVSAKPGDPNRPAGKILILSTKDGSTLAEIHMPDGRECYMSPVIFDFEGDQEPEIVFGTGGETIGGNLYILPLKGVIQNSLSALIKLDSSDKKGYIAPPVLADVNHDQIMDIIVPSMDGRIMAIDGSSHSKLWETSHGQRSETQSMVTPGYFNTDRIPDFFCTISKGEWPKIDTVMHTVLDGANGRELFRDSLGILQFSSAVSYDMDRDGTEDIIQYINRFENDNFYDRRYENQVYIYNIKRSKITPLSPARAGANLGSTPLIADLDDDGLTDFIFCYITEDSDLTRFSHLVIERVEFNIPYKESSWGSYMGTNYNSIFQ